MIQNKQKMLLHIYAGAAGLEDPVYRDILLHRAGVSSASDRAMTQSGFEQAMAALETVLFLRVHAREVRNPIGNSRYILSEFYWRRRLPREGLISRRQAYKIEELWVLLQRYLPDEDRNLVYLGGIVRKATGKTDPGYTCLTSREAECLIDALKDRLAHALKRDDPFAEIPETEQSPKDLEEVPF